MIGKNHEKLLAIIILLIFSFTLTGCYDRREIDDLAYVIALGLDIGQTNELRMTLQLALPIAMGSGAGESEGGGGGGESESTSLVTIEAPTIYSGLNMINNLVSKELNLTHAKVIIISRRLAEKGIDKYLNAIVRGREFRPDVFVMVTNEPPDKYLEKTKPILESNTSKYFDLLLGNRFSSFYPAVRFDQFYQKSKSDSVQPVAIFSQLSKYENTEQLDEAGNQNHDGLVMLEGEYIAGDIPVVSKQQVEVMGMAVFKNSKMVGTANGIEAACYQIITGEYNYSYWTIHDPYDESKLLVLNIFQRRKPVIKADIVDNKAKFNISIDLEGDFTSVQSSYNYGENPEIIEQAYEAFLEKQIADFLKKTTDEFNSDICGFGNYLKRKFLTLDDWAKFNWFEKYKDSTFNIDVSMKIRRTGLIIRSVDNKASQ